MGDIDLQTLLVQNFEKQGPAAKRVQLVSHSSWKSMPTESKDYTYTQMQHPFIFMNQSFGICRGDSDRADRGSCPWGCQVIQGCKLGSGRNVHS